MGKIETRQFNELIGSIKACQICKAKLTHQPKPIFQLNPAAKILIAGQAPGKKAHDSGIPFDDPSGDRLRKWMGVSKEYFYDETKLAILPMGFCFPGSGESGDLPPRNECAMEWRQSILDQLPNIKLMLVIGTYAMKWHLGDGMQRNLTETIMAWEQYRPKVMPLPHPSPRNNVWLSKNPWFEQEVLVMLRKRIKRIRFD